MIRRRTVAIGTVLAATVLLALLPVGNVISQELSRVFVTNFPNVFEVRGKVEVDGPIPMTSQQSFTNITVSPVKPSDTLRLVKAGVLESDGFSEVVLSLEGEVRGDVSVTGEVGAILVPDEELIQQAFAERGSIHFSLTTRALRVDSSTPYFASEQRKEILGFDRYRIYLYNTTDKAVRVDLFAYLTP